MKSQDVLVIGSNGYIASRLIMDLQNQYHIEGCDRFPCINRTIYSHIKDYDAMYISDLAKYDTIILLAANSSVSSCSGDFIEPYKNNVQKLVTLLDKISIVQKIHKKKIKFIYASSSSVYGVGFHGCKEDCKLSSPHNHYDATKQLGDIIALRYINEIELYGLRFGTVNGWSPNMRWDLMINSMYKSAKETNIINISNPKITRPILAIYDIVSAIKTILDYDETGNVIKRGIYNLCSFNSTVEEIATEIKDFLKISNVSTFIKVNENIAKNSADIVYDFSIDNSKFCTAFKWSPKYEVKPPNSHLQIDHIIIDLNKQNEL